MALRTHSGTSGPGRAHGSDVRARHGRARPRPPGGPPRTAQPAAPTPLRRRADALFADVSAREPNRPAARVSGPGPAQPSTAAREAAVAEIAEGGAAAEEAESPAAARRRGRAGLAVRERLPVWVQLRCGLEPRTLAALAVVLVISAVLAAQHFWSARPQVIGAPDTARRATAMSGLSPAPSPGGPVPAAAGGGRVTVDVSGKVRRPSVLRLPAGSRVADALRAAGGVTAGTDLTGLNRARVLMDGEQVVVGATPPPGAGAGRAGVGVGGGQGTGPVSLGAGTQEQLESLPGVGPVLARHIIDYRTRNGGFRSVDQLREVNGIGERRLADLQSLVVP